MTEQQAAVLRRLCGRPSASETPLTPGETRTLGLRLEEQDGQRCGLHALAAAIGRAIPSDLAFARRLEARMKRLPEAEDHEHPAEQYLAGTRSLTPPMVTIVADLLGFACAFEGLQGGSPLPNPRELTGTYILFSVGRAHYYTVKGYRLNDGGCRCWILLESCRAREEGPLALGEAAWLKHLRGARIETWARVERYA
jgi:hypothetical protein